MLEKKMLGVNSTVDYMSLLSDLDRGNVDSRKSNCKRSLSIPRSKGGKKKID